MESTEVMRAMCMIDLGHRYERSGDGDDAEHDGRTAVAAPTPASTNGR
jgi:hypothetical protein